MNDHRTIVLRLTGRPELERGTWMVQPDWVEAGIITATGAAVAVPTGHFEGDHEVWVPKDERDNWPPHERRLINILKDEGEDL